MTVNDAVEQVQFVVDADGKPTAALLNISAWRTLLAAVEEADDQALIHPFPSQRHLAHSSEEMELVDWDLTSAQLDVDEDH